jgi:hypothetical protein
MIIKCDRGLNKSTNWQLHVHDYVPQIFFYGHLKIINSKTPSDFTRNKDNEQKSCIQITFTGIIKAITQDIRK